MPTFDFTGGADAFSSASTFNLSYTDTSTGPSVTFTLSTTANANGGFVSGFSQVLGQVSISDTVPGGAFTLDVNAGGTLTNFGGDGGNIALDLGSFVSGTWNITFVHETNVALNETFVVDSTTDVVSFSATGSYQNVLFTPLGPGGAITVDSLTATITCYLEGTGIATPKGRVAVETLQPGDEILTADGGTTKVRWLGVQPIDTTVATPAKANPICFKAGSIAPGVPSRDLFVSPDHAMEIDGILYNATALVNGRSIYQVAQMPMDGFTYYHIDTGTHELVLAEDAASETYLDAVGRDAFINGYEQADAPIITEMAVPRIVAKRMVPQDVMQALSERADALGLMAPAKVA